MTEHPETKRIPPFVAGAVFLIAVGLIAFMVWKIATTPELQYVVVGVAVAYIVCYVVGKGVIKVVNTYL